MNPSITLGVTSYFIGVSIGDAAIHILWSKQDGVANPAKVVRRAIMVDGGAAANPFKPLGQKLTHPYVTSAIEDIEDHFTCQDTVRRGGSAQPPDKNRLLFDAFVVTHWDHDHYQGVITFLIQDMRDSHRLGNLNRLSRAIYNDNGEPVTMFYAPYWRELSRPNNRYTYPNLNQYMVADADPAGNNTMRIHAENNIWYPKMLHIRVGANALLGRDLFARGDPLFTAGHVAECNSLDKLMELYHEAGRYGYQDITESVLDGRCPGFYCVAVNRNLVGQDMALEEPLPGHTITPTNMSSICCLLVWLPEKYVSLFSAGDADAVLEDDIARWMGYNEKDKNRVTIAKLSHHGSASSTSTNLMPALKPKHLVAMSGGNPVHGHPRWEVLHDLLSICLFGSHNSDPYFAPKPLHLLRYPSYFVSRYTRTRNERFYSSIEHLRGVFERMHARIEALQAYYPTEEILKICPLIFRWVCQAYEANGQDWNVIFADEHKDQLRRWVAFSTRGEVMQTVVFDEYRIWQWQKKWISFTIIGVEDNLDNEIMTQFDGRAREAAGQGPWVRMALEKFLPGLYFAEGGTPAHQNSTAGLTRRGSASSTSSWDILEPASVLAGDGDELEGVCVTTSVNTGVAPSPYILVPQGWATFVFGEKPAPDPGSYTTVPKGNPFYEFLTRLPSLHLKLESKPNPSTSSVRIALDAHDGLPWWLQAVLLVGRTGKSKRSPGGQTATKFTIAEPTLATMYLEASEWPPSDTTTFELSVIVTMTLSSGLQVSLTLDTRDANKCLGVEQKSVKAMFSETSTLCLGINLTSTQAQWKLSDLVDLIQFPHNKAVTLLRELPIVPINTAAKGRNAMWYASGVQRATTLRLEFGFLKEVNDHIKEWLHTARFGINIKDESVRVIARRSMHFCSGLPDSGKKATSAPIQAAAEPGNPASPGGRLSKGSEAMVRGDITFGVGVELVDLGDFGFNLFVTISDDHVRLRLQRDAPSQGKDSELTQLLKWAAGHLGNRDGSKSEGDKYKDSTWGACEAWIDAASGFLNAIRPRVVEFTLGYDDEGKFQGLETASITLQVELTLGKAAKIVDDKNKLVFFLTFRWGKTSGIGFDGSLWCQTPEMEGKIDYTEALPAWERYLEVKPSDPETTIDNVDLKKLLEIDSLPAGVPTQITTASISLDANAMTIEGAISCTYDRSKSSKVPMLILDNLAVTIVRNFKKSEKGKPDIPASWEACLEFTLFLWPGGKDPTDDGDGGEKTLAETLKDLPCRITGGLYYSSTAAAALADANKSSWTMKASIDGLSVSHLAPFWPEGEVRNAVMDMLSHIELEHLGLEYYYGPKDGDGGSDFKFDGVLKLGGLKLKLDFHCDSVNGWEFGATLQMPTESGADNGPGGDTGGSATVETILTALFGKGNVPAIPGGVLDVPVSRPKSDGEVLSVKCVLVNVKGDASKGEKDSQVLMCTASIHISAISLTLTQWRDTSWVKGTPSKRIVKIALSDLPEINAPLVGKLEQPFEQLVYMWVSAKQAAKKDDPKILVMDGAGDKKTVGVTHGEFKMLNDKLLQDDQIYFKADAPDPEKIKNGDVVIEAGSHFMVVAKMPKGQVKAVLDYVFGRPKPLSAPGGKTVAGQQGLDAIYDDKDEKPNTEPAKAPFKKSAGPLSIENVGLTYDANKNRLGIVLDATFLFGPFGLALIGFGLSVELVKGKASVVSDDWEILSISTGSGVACDEPMALLPAHEDDVDTMLGSLPVANPQVTLDGVMVSFDRPPVTIAGGFVRTQMDEATYYAGGLIVGFKPWKLMAMGVYGQIPKKKKTADFVRRKVIELSDDYDGNDDDISTFDGFTDDEGLEVTADDGTYTMVFVILKVQGPLFSIGFADISGLTAGVGVNSSIRLPTADTVLDFPFTKPEGTPGPNEGPLSTLKAVLFPPNDIVPWFAPREGAIWIAAGLTATAFTMLSANAVLIVTTSPSVQVGIFGVATIDVPSLVAPVKFAHAEIGFACVFDPDAGTFRFDAQLSPRSFVLHESCHLSGGMALYAWAKTGDFVFTLGGYHQAFVPAEHYPSPPRLRISWSLSDVLRISGEAYFAVTPRMCMGGGKLNATLNQGPLSAWFDAFLDFLINFRPFKFAADGGLAVGVRFTLDLWLVTIRIQAEIKAVLSVLGPPMAGRVHVDFWVFGFDIDFGDRDGALLNSRKSMLTLDEFRDLVVKGGGSATKGLPAPMDWVDVARGRESSNVGDSCGDVVANDKEPTEPFLFNCTGGLLPDSDVKAPPKESSGSPPSPLAGQDDETSWMTTMFNDGTVIPEDTWAVKAGELDFSLTLAFAASNANVYDNRPSRMTPKLEVCILDAQKKIYALPLRLTGAINSTVDVTIDQQQSHVVLFDDNCPPPEREPDRWLVQPVLKNVPNNLWAVYDAASDPALAGNAVASLLNAPTVPGSVSLVMGLTFQPPLPFLSKDTVPKFNIVNDMLQRVKDEGYAFRETERRASKEWNPVDRQEARKEWKRVVDAWDTEACEKRAGDAVRLWSEGMGWKVDGGKGLVGVRPRALLRRFEDMVPAAPRIAAVVAAAA